MTKITAVYGAKGGVGTTVVASLLGLALAEQGPTLLVDNTTTTDVATVLGVRAGDQMVDGGLHISTRPVDAYDPDEMRRFAGFEHVVVDAGREVPGWADEAVCVVRNDYLSLRAAVCSRWPADHVVVVMMPHMTLDVDNVRGALGCQPLVMSWDSRLARTVDAGLGSRLHPFSRPLKALL